VKARRLAKAQGLGRVMAVFRTRKTWIHWLIVGPAWAFLQVAVLLNPLGDPAADLATVAGSTAICWLALAAMSSDRLVVAEGGLLLGSLAPGLTPYRLRWAEIDLDTIAFIDNADRLLAATGTTVSSARRAGKGSGLVLSLAGPAIHTCGLGGWGVPWWAPPDASTGGNLWLFGCRPSDREGITRALLQSLLGVEGSTRGRLGAQLAEPIRLSADPASARDQIPGYLPTS
jgi:hypothetical protein